MEYNRFEESNSKKEFIKQGLRGGIKKTKERDNKKTRRLTGIHALIYLSKVTQSDRYRTPDTPPEHGAPRSDCLFNGHLQKQGMASTRQYTPLSQQRGNMGPRVPKGLF